MAGDSFPGSGYNDMGGNGSYPPPQYQQGPRQSQYQQQGQSSSPVVLPPGKNDLEILENLKKLIKDGQHHFYRAIPQPESLAKLYMGVIPTQPAENGLSGGPAKSDHSTSAKQSDTPVSPLDSSRRPPRLQNKDGNEASHRKPSVSSGHAQSSATLNGHVANGHSTAHSGRPLDKPPANGSTAAPTSASATSTSDPNAMDVTQDYVNNRTASGGASAKAVTPSAKPPGLPSKPDLPQALVERTRADSSAGRLPASLPEKPSVDVRVGPGRPAPPSNVWQGRNDSGRPEIYDRSTAAAPGSTAYPPRGGPDNRNGPPPPSSDPYAQDDRLYERDNRDFRDRNRRDWAERKPNDRYSRNSVELMKRPAPEDRHYEPAQRRPGPVKTEEIPISLSELESRSAPPHSPSGPAESRPGYVDNRAPHDFPPSNEPLSYPEQVPGLSAGNDKHLDSQPPPAATTGRPSDDLYPHGLARQDLPPKTGPRDHSLPPKERGPSPFPKPSHANGDLPEGPAHTRPNERYPRTASPTVKPGPREDARGLPAKVAPSPTPNLPRHTAQRDYRGPPAEGNRSYRPPPNNYRPDYGDARRPDRMDVDEPRYMDRSYRPYSPPPDPSRDRVRPVSPLPGRTAAEYEDPRRYPGAPPPGANGRDWYAGAPPPPQGYSGQQQRWEDDPYYKGRNHWDPSLERDRYERDPARAAWDARTDRDPRGYARGPTPVAAPVDDRYPAPPRDPRPPPAAAPPAPYSRTRPRSPSPVRRGGGPMLVDDGRPPLKRARDDYGAPVPPAEYYSPRPAPGDYRSPPGGPSAPSSGGFYDRGGPPPPSSSTVSDRDRDYMRRDPSLDYPPPHAPYGRPRTPPGSRPGSSGAPYDNRAAYSRPPPNPRDRAYGMPPPARP